MSLLDQARTDLSSILGDTVGGFSVDVLVSAPDGRQEAVSGFFDDISERVEPDTGIVIAGRQTTVAIPIAALEAVSLIDIAGIHDDSETPWTVTFGTDVCGDQVFRVIRSNPDRTLGLFLCYLEPYSEAG